MIHVLLASHGNLAKGMAQAAEMLIGDQRNLECITFKPDMGFDELNEQFGDKIKDVSEENQYIILCDIKGGTPFNAASRFSYHNENVAVIYGVNLPILITVLLESAEDGMNLQKLSDSARRQSAETIGLSEL